MTKAMDAIWDTPAEISHDNKIFAAAVMAEPQDACKFLQRALGIEDCDANLIDVPERRQWMRASIGSRLKMLADWMRFAVLILIERTDVPVENHYPTDFSLRTND